MASVNPYLNYKGNCEEAFNHYKKVFGGEFAFLSRFSEMPPDHPCDPDEKDKIMHVSLPIGNTILMGSDIPKKFDNTTFGNNFAVTVAPETKEEATQIFNGLAEGGNVTMPLGPTFWAEAFGMLVDKFGVSWMVNLPMKQ
ncbi:PhnB protein [Chitinophaga dinghuensis]|uniref:PhnB protein n=1 Tax=Chitinophaga dinghuensis TaxID=1539050 RepID=A0A327VQ35_9BACT|nr:VOC family protein [Chitinophaga dinghuensis]RAJ76534.1 PhnB protein [Chitinophaga dinghuensis]